MNQLRMGHMSKKLLLTLLPLLMMAGTAQAAFEWVPSAQPATNNASTVPLNNNEFVPLPDKGSVISEPLAMPASVPVPPAPAMMQSQDQMAMSSTPAKEPVIAWNPQVEPTKAVAMPPKEPLAMADKTMESKPVGFVEGFGRDIPLSIATAQIVPSDFSVQYGAGVSPDVLVNWQGGRDWKAALTDAVSAQGLTANISGQTVIIESNAPVYVAPSPILPQPTAPVRVASSDIQTESIAPVAMNNLFTPLAPIANDAGSNLNSTVMWVAPRASTLRQVLTDWSREAGVQLQWSAQYDYPLMSDVQVSGTFEDAVENILAGLIDAQPRPVARLHPNEPSGPAILVVETRYIME